MLLSPVEIKNAVLMALGSLTANKFRAFLTILGVTVGVASVIGMASVVNGLQESAEQEVDRMGSNIITVNKFPDNTDWDNLTDEERNRAAITSGEADAIMANCPSVDGVAPRNYYFRPEGNEVKYLNRKFNNPYFLGTWPDYVNVKDKPLKSGNFFSGSDLNNRLMVCVLGSDVAEVLFEGENPVGKEVRVNGQKFEVRGVLEPVKSNFGGDSENKYVMVPLSTFEKLIPWEKELALDCRAQTREDIDEAIEEITSCLRIYRKVPFNKEDNFALSTQDQFKEEIGNITKYIYLASLVITSVGLMVGGIGVMNIMLVSVTERTREIGIRKAIGAKKANIILQFLTEAITLTATGGIIGIIAGLGLGMLVNSLLDYPLGVSVFWVITGFVVSVSVGLVSGIYPAIKAARLDPIESLRYE